MNDESLRSSSSTSSFDKPLSSGEKTANVERSKRSWFISNAMSTDKVRAVTYHVKVDERHGPVELRVSNRSVGLDARYHQARMQGRSNWGFDSSTIYLGFHCIPDENRIGKNGRPIESAQVVDSDIALEAFLEPDIVADMLEDKTRDLVALWNRQNSSEASTGCRNPVHAEFVLREKRLKSYSGIWERTQSVIKLDTFIFTQARQNDKACVIITPRDVTISLKFRSTANLKSK